MFGVSAIKAEWVKLPGFSVDNFFDKKEWFNVRIDEHTRAMFACKVKEGGGISKLVKIITKTYGKGMVLVSPINKEETNFTPKAPALHVICGHALIGGVKDKMVKALAQFEATLVDVPDGLLHKFKTP